MTTSEYFPEKKLSFKVMKNEICNLFIPLRRDNLNRFSQEKTFRFSFGHMRHILRMRIYNLLYMGHESP